MYSKYVFLIFHPFITTSPSLGCWPPTSQNIFIRMLNVLFSVFIRIIVDTTVRNTVR